MSQKHLILVAGGTGSRMNGQAPKQFIKIKDKPVIVFSIEKFLQFDKHIQIVIVSHKDHSEQLKSILDEYFPKVSFSVVEGGDTRFGSVKNGLKVIANDGVVAIHDAARPLVSLKTIENCFEMAIAKGNAIPVVEVTESLRSIDVNSNKAANRKNFKIVQTPQCFKTSLIQKAFEQEYEEAFTDDATVLEKSGQQINLVEGNSENIKITTPRDLIIAEALLK